MSTRKPNNPRAFAETVSIDAWRKPFSGDRAEADLHIDVVFATGRVGGTAVATDCPVRFRLSLRRAEVHILRDTGGILDIVSSSVSRSGARHAKKSKIIEKSASASAKGSMSASAANIDANLSTSLGGSFAVSEKVEQAREIAMMKVTHRRTERGYAFRIEPQLADRLDGEPWSSAEPRMKVRDSKSDRKRGEPPDIIVEVHCRKEDLIIEDIQFSEQSKLSWSRLTRNKRLTVEQYIKQELLRMGLHCDDLDDPFSRIILADVSAVVE